MVLVVAGAACALIFSFALAASAAVAPSGMVLAAAIVIYATLAVWTLTTPAADRRSAVIARGLALAILALATTAILGAGLAGTYGRANPALLSVAPSHALLGIIAWLTTLVAGVSTRTFQPLLGLRSRWPRAHALAGAGLLTGAIVAAVAAPWSAALLRLGILIAAAGTLAYAFDAADVLRRSRGPHRVVRAFVSASVGWLIVSTALAIAASWGADAGRAAVVIALAGWLGQMVNAHLHHLGVRVVATYILGDDDETRPWTLLTPALSWTAFVAAQFAVFGTAVRAQGATAQFAVLGGTAGLICVSAMVVNVANVIARAQRMRADRIVSTDGAPP
jgi:hypothetical protein